MVKTEAVRISQSISFTKFLLENYPLLNGHCLIDSVDDCKGKAVEYYNEEKRKPQGRLGLWPCVLFQ